MRAREIPPPSVAEQRMLTGGLTTRQAFDYLGAMYEALVIVGRC